MAFHDRLPKTRT